VLVKTPLRRMQYRLTLLAAFLSNAGLEYGPFLQHPPLTIVRHPHITTRPVPAQNPQVRRPSLTMQWP
jgi:hypothetical protein